MNSTLCGLLLTSSFPIWAWDCILSLLVAPQNEEPKYRELFDVMQFSVKMADQFWRSVYNGGMWFGRELASHIVQYGWLMAAA